MDLRDIRDRTYKSRDAWWTVILVDPLAVRLVRLVAPYRWITPNLLSGLAFVMGLGAAWCFAQADRWWLVAGALLFHLSFVVDCMGYRRGKDEELRQVVRPALIDESLVGKFLRFHQFGDASLQRTFHPVSSHVVGA